MFTTCGRTGFGGDPRPFARPRERGQPIGMATAMSAGGVALHSFAQNFYVAVGFLEQSSDVTDGIPRSNLISNARIPTATTLAP